MAYSALGWILRAANVKSAWLEIWTQQRQRGEFLDWVVLDA